MLLQNVRGDDKLADKVERAAQSAGVDTSAVDSDSDEIVGERRASRTHRRRRHHRK